MRIIAGKNRGRILKSPQDLRVRPTSDRVKESIFNILSSRLDINGAHVLDLFSGSGGLGLEAVSRGAESAVFVDIDRDSLNLAKENARLINAENCTFILSDYSAALKSLSGRRFDVIFADSPYKMLPDEVFSGIYSSGVCGGALLVLEHSAKNHLLISADGIIIEERKYGNTAISIADFRKK